MPIKPILPDPPKPPIHIPDPPKPEHPIAKAIVEDKIESRALSARQQTILDAIMNKQVEIMELFKRNGMDSMDQLHAWRDLLIIFTPTS